MFYGKRVLNSIRYCHTVFPSDITFFILTINT